MNNRYAAIDIGSNGVRLLMASITFENGSMEIRKDSAIRIPIRLGEDVFSTGQISKQKESDLIETLQGFAHLIRFYKPVEFRAVATSAMREASNADHVIKKLYRKSKIHIETISGPDEAKTIYSAHTGQNNSSKSLYILIDVGGGSTETVFFKNNQILEYMSFKLGTVRNLQGNEDTNDFNIMKKWLNDSKQPSDKIIAIGTGGNINRAMKLLGQKKQSYINFNDLKMFYNKLNSLSVQERMTRYKLKSDRADVIVPAMNIYLTVMKQMKIKKINVPGIGLIDGIIHEMARKYHHF